MDRLPGASGTSPPRGGAQASPSDNLQWRDLPMASRKTALTLALGSAVAATLVAAPLANANDNPFKLQSLKSGYQVADTKGKEGKCGEGKCGGDKKKDGACGGDKAKEGACGGDKAKDGASGDKAKEGACGGDKAKDGKCGGNK
jgi:uncharacterized low-complexity protein